MDIARIQEKLDELESYLSELEALLPEYENDYRVTYQESMRKNV